jgi:capsular polysaccharide biosynthesis protein/Mrp family chromosome partitioning ATPase
MAVSSPPLSYEMSDYGGVLRRRWWIVLLVTCLGVLVAGLYVASAHKTYDATALVQVNPLPTNTSSSTGANVTGGRTAGAVNMDNQAQVAQSTTVAALANKQLHSTLSLPALIKQTAVAVPPNTTFMQISCHAPSPKGAAACANDFGNAYLTYSLSSAVTAASQTDRTLTAGITKINGQIRLLRGQLSTLPAKSPKRIAAGVTLDVDTIAVHGLESQLNTAAGQLAALTPGAAGSIASPATPPSVASSPRLLLLLPSGLLAGLVIGLLLAFFVDRRDKRVHSSRDLERFFGVPALLNSVRRNAQLQTSLAPPGSQAGRAFAELAQAVAASFAEGDHVLLVAGTSPGNGSSLIAANLAATLARSRSEVVLVSAGIESSLANRLFATGDGPGLSELLAGDTTVSEAARRAAGIPRLRVITHGHDTGIALENPNEATGRLLQALTHDAHYVIVEVKSVGEDSATFTMAEFADAGLIVVEIDRTKRFEVLDAVHGLQRVHVPVIGAAVLPKSHRGRTGQPASPRRAAPAAEDGRPTKSAGRAKAARSGASSGNAGQRGNGAVPPAARDTSRLPPATVAPRPPES